MPELQAISSPGEQQRHVPVLRVVVVLDIERALVLAEGVEQAAALRNSGQLRRLTAEQREAHQRQLDVRPQRRVLVQSLHLEPTFQRASQILLASIR